ncbi:MAG: hypothetical protein ACPH9F_07760 [Candidatus Poseidoniaceae archaeon]
MGKQSSFVVFSILLITIAGCTSSNNVNCGEGYDEMYGGYDYGFNSTSVNAQNSLQVTMEIVNGGGGWWLEESETYQESQTLWVDITVKFADGTTEEIAFKQSNWNNFGDGNSGSSWSKHLTFISPDGFCDDGCEEVRFSAGFEYGTMYHDGTCESSPWVDID